MSEKFYLDRLSNPSILYLKSSKSSCINSESIDCLNTMDFLALYKVEEITFEEKSPRKEALENVISSMSIEGVNFVYMILGDALGVNFYYGVARDFSFQKDLSLEINEIGEKILKPSLQGNFRGSVITEIEPKKRKIILGKIKAFKNAKILEGVPGINKDDEAFQSVDRVIDVMLGDLFAVVLLAKPITGASINKIQESMYHLYDSLSPISKTSIQNSTGESVSTSNSTTIGESKTEGTNTSDSQQTGSSDSTSNTSGTTMGSSKNTGCAITKEKESHSGSEGTNESKSESEAKQHQDSSSTSHSKGSSESTSTNKSSSESKQDGKNTGSSATLEIVNKKAMDWVKYMDDVILPRLDYGLGKGLFVTTTLLLGNNPASIIKLENTLKSVYGGESGNRMPLHAFSIDPEETVLLKNMQIPIIEFQQNVDEDEIAIRAACSQFFFEPPKALLGNWMSSREMSLIAGLPQKEVVGLKLKEEVEFGLNIESTQEENSILLGHLVQSGAILDGKKCSSNIPVYYDKTYLDKHIFVTGVTGSGKTTTCQKLLFGSGNNFMVIEPAKTEYRILAEKDIPDLLVFTLGNENSAPFRLNPFEFFEGENITSRVDMIMASMEAAFDMEAAIPQLIETAIYECYKDKGWNISNNKNIRFENPFADGIYAFPTFGDLIKKVDEVVKGQGFDDRLKDEYIGSIHARLNGLNIGSKGLMLNTPRSINFIELLDKKVILELEYIKSGPEKSLIMGFILSNLTEAIRAKYDSNGKKPINHITLIEEAHRLLSKYMPGDNMNKKQGVEMFANMLAEVRKYGESLIIADQIPNKLTPEVLKNTNTKIVHRIFAQDDKEAIGNTMALDDEQKKHLSYLASGRAIMMNPGLSKAIQIQIDKTTENDTTRPPLDDRVLRERIIEYYRKRYKRGILPNLEQLNFEPDSMLVSTYLDYLQHDSHLLKGYYSCIHNRKISEMFVDQLKFLKRNCDIKFVAMIIAYSCHRKEYLISKPEIVDYVKEVLEFIIDKGVNYPIKEYKNILTLDGAIL